MIAPLFSCSQTLMYQTAKTMWLNCKKFIEEMKSFKGFYSADYCDERIAEIDAAEAMKSEAARALIHEALRIDLVNVADDCRAKWQALKQYIATVYKDKELREANWRGAGWANYDKAGDNNWTSLKALMNEGYLYLTENSAILLANENMPTTFAAAFLASKNSFNTKFTTFDQALITAHTDTDTKNVANNNVYQMAVDMGQDGQFVFRADESLRSQFSFEAMSSLIEPKGASTVVVELTDAETNAPIEKFDVTNLETNRTVTAVDGRAEMGQQAETEPDKTRKYKIVADGYPEKIIEVKVNAGVKVVEKVAVAPIIGVAAKKEIEESKGVVEPELVVVEK